ncbi:MAG: hypothetical protein ABI045_06105 [Flavobacteriales bacterium]
MHGDILSKVALSTVIPIGNYNFFYLREKKYILSQEVINLIEITKDKSYYYVFDNKAWKI